MKKANVEQMKNGIGTLATSFDTQWFAMNCPDLSADQLKASENIYIGMTRTLRFLGGDWKRDEKGHHRVFLAGMSSCDTDDYKKED